jgi:AcrR family transcriptional regulator
MSARATPPASRRRLLPRAERRASILKAAATAFARGGFADTSLEDIAAQAGVTRMILYRHFESKRQLYEAILAEVREHIRTAAGPPSKMGPATIAALVEVAAADPDGFRLYYRHAAREPEFRHHADELHREMVANSARILKSVFQDPGVRRLGAELMPRLIIETTLAWLDAGQPDIDIVAVVRGVARGAVVALGGDLETIAPSSAHLGTDDGQPRSDR